MNFYKYPILSEIEFSKNVLGNKCDLDGLREVEKSEAEALCSYMPEVLHVMETSAKDNINVDTIFFTIAAELKVINE